MGHTVTNFVNMSNIAQPLHVNIENLNTVKMKLPKKKLLDIAFWALVAVTIFAYAFLAYNIVKLFNL